MPTRPTRPPATRRPQPAVSEAAAAVRQHERIEDQYEIDVKEFERALTIDENRLEYECSTNPRMYYQVARALALAISQRDQAIRQRKVTEAQAAKRLREQLETLADEGKRVTEKQVDVATELDPAVIDAYQKVLDLNLEVDLLTAMKEGFADRSHMLRKLSDLWISNYYGSELGPSSRAVQASGAERAKERAAATRRPMPNGPPSR